jgi:hypothetical protein
MHWPITVASFRTWRGSRDYIARDPASDIVDINIRVSCAFQRIEGENHYSTRYSRAQC